MRFASFMFFQDDDNPWASPPNSEPPKSTRENASKRENRGGPYNQNGGRVEDFVSRFQDRLRNGGGGGGGGGGTPTPQASPFLFALIGIVGFVFWAASGLFRVQEGELGVVLRFGEMINIVQPGLRYRLPYPFEQEIVRKVLKLMAAFEIQRAAKPRIKIWC
jgi:membrane protease subunit HflK